MRRNLLLVIVCLLAFNVFCGVNPVLGQTLIAADKSSDGSTADSPVWGSVTMEDGAVIRLERLNGGYCNNCPPRYTLTIYEDGTVIYEGIEFVKTKGKVTINIGREKVKQMMERFEKIGFFSIGRDYIAIDRPVAALSANFHGKARRRIENSYGFDTDVKEAQNLIALENEIDEVVQSWHWIK